MVVDITEFPINSYVLVNYEGDGHKPPSKLHTFFEIDAVEQHRFLSNKKRRSDLEFLIRFQGDQQPVKQSWSIDIGKSEKVHTYLQDNNIRKYIPQQFTYPKDYPLYEKPVRRKNPVQEDQPKKKRRKKRSSY